MAGHVSFAVGRGVVAESPARSARLPQPRRMFWKRSEGRAGGQPASQVSRGGRRDFLGKKAAAAGEVSAAQRAAECAGVRGGCSGRLSPGLSFLLLGESHGPISSPLLLGAEAYRLPLRKGGFLVLLEAMTNYVWIQRALKGEQAVSPCKGREAFLCLTVWQVKKGFMSCFVFLQNRLTLSVLRDLKSLLLQ